MARHAVAYLNRVILVILYDNVFLQDFHNSRQRISQLQDAASTSHDMFSVYHTMEISCRYYTINFISYRISGIYQYMLLKWCVSVSSLQNIFFFISKATVRRHFKVR